MLKKWKTICILLCLSISLFFYSYHQESKVKNNTLGTLEIYYIDVGQGDAICITCNKEAMLIDGGDSSSSSTIYSFLEQHNITDLKYIVVSHPHEDHVGGLSGAIQYAECEEILTPTTSYDSGSYSTFLSKAQEKEIEVHVAQSEETYTLADATFTIYLPSNAEDENNYCSIVKLNYGNTSFLFTGDAEMNEEHSLIKAYGSELQSDVIKVNHHGSSDGFDINWYATVQPSHAIISCGKGNLYGHPHQSTLDYLKSNDIDTYRTDLQGTILCTSDGTNIQFETEKETDKDIYVASTISQESVITVDTTIVSNYVLNTHSMKVHKPTCESVNDISMHNKQEVKTSLDSLLEEGYSLCKNCLQVYEKQ